MLTPLHAPPACPSETLCRAGHRHRGFLGSDGLVLTSLLLRSACSLLQRPSPSSPASPAWQRQGRKLPLHSLGSPGSARRKCQAQCPLPGEALHANDWPLSGCNCHCLADHPAPPAGQGGSGAQGSLWCGEGWAQNGSGTGRGSWHFLFVGRAARAQL